MADQPLDVFELPVHPAAAEFPMLPDNELQALAADIKANGLHHPLLVGEVDSVLMLMDGRNRREACRIAGVTPTVENITGDDLIMRLWSENGRRRDLSKGAKAMVAACIFSRPEQGKRKTSLKIKEVGVNAGSLSQARTIIRHAPELVDDVKVGQRSLLEAYKIACVRKKVNEREDRLVQSVAPDLAGAVAHDGDKLTLVDACAGLAQGDNIQHAICDDVGKGSGSVAVASEAAKEDPEVQRQVLTVDRRELRRKICETTAKGKPQPAAQPAAACATAHEASTNIRQHSARIVESIRGIGEELVRAKAKLPDGSFSQWLQCALGWTLDNARRFIEVRDGFKADDTAELGAVDLSVLHVAASLAGDQPVKAAEAPEPGILAAE